MKTLIVEDDVTNQVLLTEFLKTFGSITVAINGKEAVALCRSALLQREPFDLICMDIALPELDGTSALQAIRALEEEHFPVTNSKVVMTTAMSDLENMRHAFLSQCDAYLIKPIDRTELLGLLEKLDLIQHEKGKQ